MRHAWRGLIWRARALLLATAAGGVVQQAPAPALAATSPQDQAAWDKARGSGSAAAFQRYLEVYPTGAYAEEAFRILVEKSWRPPRRTEPPSNPRDPSEPDAAQVAVAAQSLY